MEVLETTFEHVRLQLKIEGSDKLESNHKILVKCSHQVEEEWITQDVVVESDDELAMYKVFPNTKYNCSGTVIDDDEIIPVKEVSVFTCDEKQIEIQTRIEEIQTDNFRFVH